jgi:oxygen-independent coproporphyrinogen-3 oxidase
MVTDEIAIEQMNYLLDFAEASGFEAYEISNFAKEGYRAIHNSNYWKGIPYLGFGPSAHSYDGVNRRANISHNLDYIKAVSTGLDYFNIEILSNKNRCNEFLMLNLRKILLHIFHEFIRFFNNMWFLVLLLKRIILSV